MADNRVVYLGKSSAIDADALEGFTPSEMDELLVAVEGFPRLREKIRRARNWEPAELVDDRGQLAQGLSGTKPSPGYKETLIRNTRASKARRAILGVEEISEHLAAADVPVGSVVRSASGTIACRFDETHGTVFGDERAFDWSMIESPVQVLWVPIRAQSAETMEEGR